VSVKLPERVLRLGLALTLTLAGLKLAEVPGAEIVIIVVLAACALLLLAAGVRAVRTAPARAGSGRGEG
jgi:hypothetical protein